MPRGDSAGRVKGDRRRSLHAGGLRRPLAVSRLAGPKARRTSLVVQMKHIAGPKRTLTKPSQPESDIFGAGGRAAKTRKVGGRRARGARGRLTHHARAAARWSVAGGREGDEPELGTEEQRLNACRGAGRARSIRDGLVAGFDARDITVTARKDASTKRA